MDAKLEAVKGAGRPLPGAQSDYDPLMELVGDATFVLLGEATHGTHEFYRARADITKRLVQEKGSNVIAWEADWPDATRMSRFVGEGRDVDVHAALADFERFPVWMWRNQEIADLCGWLRDYNSSGKKGGTQVRIFGLDLYSLHRSIEAVLHYLEGFDAKPQGMPAVGMKL
ncbi:MAG TPA: erythromycin esterase family protein [Verrucomicrobiae bacterium]|nr:erythromycin esterase family protein [Verrucomicrobiae bacterium]